MRERERSASFFFFLFFFWSWAKLGEVSGGCKWFTVGLPLTKPLFSSLFPSHPMHKVYVCLITGLGGKGEKEEEQMMTMKKKNRQKGLFFVGIISEIRVCQKQKRMYISWLFHSEWTAALSKFRVLPYLFFLSSERFLGNRGINCPRGYKKGRRRGEEREERGAIFSLLMSIDGHSNKENIMILKRQLFPINTFSKNKMFPRNVSFLFNIK